MLRLLVYIKIVSKIYYLLSLFLLFLEVLQAALDCRRNTCPRQGWSATEIKKDRSKCHVYMSLDTSGRMSFSVILGQIIK